VISTRKDWLPAIIVIALTQKETRRRKKRSTDTQDEAVLSPTGAGSRESQMRGKGNHNFQLFLSYAWSLHHADNIVLYSRVLLSRSQLSLPSLIFTICAYLADYIQQRQLPIFHTRTFFRVTHLLRTWLSRKIFKDREKTCSQVQNVNSHAFSIKSKFTLLFVNIRSKRYFW